MDDTIFNFGDLVKLSAYGETVFKFNPVGKRYLGQMSEVMEKLNMTGYKVKFAAESVVFLGIDEITLVKEC
jgi:hypothetical protein